VVLPSLTLVEVVALEAPVELEALVVVALQEILELLELLIWEQVVVDLQAQQELLMAVQADLEL
jgi:hypothetical protein